MAFLRRVRSTTQTIRGVLGRAVFPHQFSFLLELPVRRVLLSPQALVTRLSLSPRDRVLEIGAGSGYYSRAIAARCGELVLLDLQAEMVRKAARLGGVGRDRMRFVCADASSLPFGPEVFDVVCMVAAFGEVSRRREMIAEIHRLLKPNGLLSVSEHFPDPDFTRFSKLKTVLCRDGFEFDRRSGPFWAYTATFKKLTS